MISKRKSRVLPDSLACQLAYQGKRCTAGPRGCQGPVRQLSPQGHGLCEYHAARARDDGIALAGSWRVEA